MQALATTSYLTSGALFLALTALLVTSWRGRLQGALLVTACVVSTIWSGLMAYAATAQSVPILLVVVTEILRGAAWLTFLLRLLKGIEGRSLPPGLTLAVHGLWIGVFVYGLTTNFFPELAATLGGPVNTLIHGALLLALMGLVLVEQFYRNSPREQRWAIKFLCLGVGGLFAYDLYMYSHGLLFRQLDPDLWAARGFINALVVPLIAISAARNPQWSLDVFVSRRFMFYTTSLVGAGLYLLAMSVGGYYLRLYGGEWGSIVQVIFLFGALVLLLVLLFSGQVRAHVRVFLSKHFYSYNYDYREEWLRLIGTLSEDGMGSDIRERAIRAIAEIVDSPAGLLWLSSRSGGYSCCAHWNMHCVEEAEAADASWIRFLEARNWVLNVQEHASDPKIYTDVAFPNWLKKMRNAWLVVPLRHHEALLGFIVLARPRAPRELNWEDWDLLKTAGRQAASYLALLETSEALSESRQFETFNRLSAYVVHDLKNIAAQLGLVVANARRHKDKPGFVDDALATLDHAVSKMNRMLGQLRKGRFETEAVGLTRLDPILMEAVHARSAYRPTPTLKTAEVGLVIRANRDRFSAVLQHLIQNAQEATPEHGHVTVTARREGEWALIEVQDTGCGMEEQFIRDRLFRPFDTTKGNAGMGIGVYESREFISASGGTLSVTSDRGEGTTFTIRLPVHPDYQTQVDSRQLIGRVG